MLIKKELNESNFYLFSSRLVCYTTVVDYKLIQRMCCFIDHICFFLSKTGLFDIYINNLLCHRNKSHNIEL